jgi:hypothetical protein
MRPRKRRGESADIAEVGARIDRWRATRTKRSPMPAPLWDAAVQLAQRHGLYAIARQLPVNYESLKGRVGGARGGREPKAATPVTPRFVELRPTAPPLLTAPLPTGPSVELVDARGEKLTLRLGPDERLDVVGLVRTFWAR